MISQKKKIYEIIVEKIEEFFLKGDLKPGEKLPPERELAKRFGVSRNSVREALQALEISGAIEIKQGGGSFIKTSEVHLLSGKLSKTVLEAETHLLDEMLELRRLLEAEAASLAAQRAAPEDLDKMLLNLEQMQEAWNDEDKGVQADLHFHLAIVKASHNRLLIGLIQTLAERMEDTIRATREHRFSEAGRYEDTLNEHREIYSAISSKNKQEAKRLMEEHIDRIRQELNLSLIVNK